MQKKLVYVLVLLLATVTTVKAQQPVYNVNTNVNTYPGKESSFNVSVIPVENSSSFKLFVQNAGKRKIDLRIDHRELGLLVDTSFASEQFSCRYNFENLEDGDYQLTISSGKEILTKAIGINTVTRRRMIVR
jgi:hypothetical protein